MVRHLVEARVVSLQLPSGFGLVGWALILLGLVDSVEPMTLPKTVVNCVVSQHVWHDLGRFAGFAR